MTMTDIRITVNAKHFAASLHFSARNDIRYYLNGVLVEAFDNEVRCAATNGHALAVTRFISDEKLPAGESVAIIVPRSTVEAIVRATKGSKHFDITNKGGKWTAITGDGHFAFDPHEATFPTYRAVFPQEPSGEASQLDPELLALFAKARKTLKAGRVRVDHNGESGCRVTLEGCDEFAGVVMPLRKGVATSHAEWVKIEKAA